MKADWNMDSTELWGVFSDFYNFLRWLLAACCSVTIVCSWQNNSVTSRWDIWISVICSWKHIFCFYVHRSDKKPWSIWVSYVQKVQTPCGLMQVVLTDGLMKMLMTHVTEESIYGPRFYSLVHSEALRGGRFIHHFFKTTWIKVSSGTRWGLADSRGNISIYLPESEITHKATIIPVY